MDRVKEILSYFLAAMAMFSIICAIYEAMNQRVGSAITLGGLFLVTTLLFYIPQLETLKAFGVEARLNRSLDRAEEIIGRLKELSLINAKVAYMTLAWGNRMGTPTAKEKQTILDEIDAQLSALNVSDAERRKAAEPLVQLIGVDLYFIYSRVIDRFVQWKGNDLTRKLNLNHTPEGQVALQKFNEEVSDWRRNSGKGPYEDRKSYDLAEHLRRATPIRVLDAKERAAADKFMAEVLSLFEACRAKGGYTPEAEKFYDKYNDLPGYELKMNEVFGVEKTAD